jgi:hypothetical protein
MMGKTSFKVKGGSWGKEVTAILKKFIPISPFFSISPEWFFFEYSDDK